MGEEPGSVVAMPEEPARRFVVFDLDGVISRHDTMAELIRRRLRSSRRRAVLGVGPAAVWFALRGFPAARIRMSRAVGTIALSGLTADDHAKLAAEVGAELAHADGWVIPQGVDAVKRHLADGDHVLVTTGTEALLVRAFLAALGLVDVELVGTVLRFDGTRPHYVTHNLGRNKVAGLGTSDVDLFYTDSELDLPVAVLAKRTILINPDAATERRFRDRVEHLEIERWE